MVLMLGRLTDASSAHHLLRLFFDGVFIHYSPMTPPILESLPTPTRILIIRLSAIGDIIMASGLIPALRQQWPNAYIAWPKIQNWIGFIGCPEPPGARCERKTTTLA